MLKRALLALAVVSLSAALAKEPGGQGTQLKYLNPADVGSATILPPAYEDGTAEQKAELAELQALAKSAPKTRLAPAQYDDLNFSPVIFKGVLPGFDPAAQSKTRDVLDAAKREAILVTQQAKEHFARKRPYEHDPSLNRCSTHRGPNPSYPSGHATAGYAMATILAHLAPEHARSIMIRAWIYGESRMICGVHYRSDVVAGQVVGTSVALALLQNPKFQSEMAAAKAELVVSGLTK